MPKATEVLYFLLHPSELRNIIQWKMWHDPVHERDPQKEDVTLQHCFIHLQKTSRSFSSVIQELHPELLVPVCLFYLILRGLDTIEDDMTVDPTEKKSLLRSFDSKIDQDGWNWNGSGPEEKDRELLVHFDCVVAEFNKLKEPYQDIIRDITKKMGNGMADFIETREANPNPVRSVRDYELYCHYVAGLVGEGLTKLFVEGKLASAPLLDRPNLYESMGQFLQQTNIIRDVREDQDEDRRFWPQEVWSKHVDDFEDLFKPEHRKAALNCNSEMIHHALTKVEDCLFYLAGIREQSVFNFCAIPQAMAIATLELCFRNPQMFERNIKIKKGDTCALMTKSTQNLQVLCEVFKIYVRKIGVKNDPEDPNFLKISTTCGKIEQFIESIFPTQIPPQSMETDTPQTLKGNEQDVAKKAEEKAEASKDIFYMLLAVLAMLTFISALMMFMAYLAGARFDLMWAAVFKGRSASDAGPDIVEQLRNKGEL